MYQPDTIYTTTETLTREKYPFVRCIKIYPKGEKIAHYEYYYNGTVTLESTYTDSAEMLIGIAKKYNTEGQLEYIEDYDKGTWTVMNFENYPHYLILEKMKKKADSLLIATYGQNFFNKHVIWEMDCSVYHDKDMKGANWTDAYEWEPKDFILDFGIKFSNHEYYSDQIEISMDSIGNFTE